ncbi:MAG: aminomethyl-transferring glycine dehydrogenase [Gammaproteobacteria bacterium]
MRAPEYYPAAEFVNRHCGPSAADEREMLRAIGLKTLDDLADILPPEIVAEAPDICATLGEDEATALLSDMARQNTAAVSMIGLGYYGTSMPAVVRRNLLESAAWYTAYTPYQAEISQGRLEMILNFQTMISDLTGLPLAGASLLDEATAAAEAMTLLRRSCKTPGNCFLADESLFPQTLAVLQTRARPLGIELKIMPAREFSPSKDVFGALFAYPGGGGEVCDPAPIVAALKQNGIISACCTDLLALSLLKPPGEMGFEAAVGSAQRFGVPMGCGGPHPGFMAFVDSMRRHAPGRIVGVSKDAKGRIGYRLALQTREQHIRREKATSNICTAQALPAMLSAAYAAYHGPERIKQTARRAHKLACILADGLKQMGRAPLHDSFFDTLRVPAEDAEAVAAAALNKNICLLSLPGMIGISADECTTPEHVEMVWGAFGANPPDFNEIAAGVKERLPAALRRETPFCAHPVFNNYHSEHEMLRYLRRLGQKDIALDRSMIPLGSCTMKLNASAEMEPLSWPLLANIHPFAPASHREGYRRLVADLENLLARISGFAAVSLQPNAGAQGEYAGLLAIRRYLKSIGQESRDVCLIPKSAHGTNPASAALAGLRVVAVEIDSMGQVDHDDLARKVETHKDKLAALMITYPSTCGVFGRGLPEFCNLVHDAGGQVYMDGANFNALVGVSLPGKIGPDVMHINLHKTFCIPHGGGGPGMGPIGVAEHLRPFLPQHPESNSGGEYDTVSAAPWGSALILHISWMYIRMMGSKGLRRATLTALLAANYIVHRLKKSYRVEFHDDKGRVAHECIVDAGAFKDAGISVEDIAKRLMDYGFHAPTVSWPVPGAMMIEPTESETKEEIDRFCDALLAIAGEIESVRAGKWPKDDNPLVNAPHPAEDLLTGEWTRPYSRETAAYPAPWLLLHKYWPPVCRIDSAWGDRNLACACPPVDAY